MCKTNCYLKIKQYYINGAQMLKTLFISHTYVVRINRKKLYDLTKKVDLILLTPTKWKHPLKVFKAEKENEIHYETKNIIFNGYEKIFFYFPWIGLGIRKIKPDIIHVEQGTDSLSYFQAILMKKLFHRKAKIVCFTWMNFDYKSPFPLNRIEKFNLKNTDHLICGTREGEKVMRKKGYKGPISFMPQVGVNPDFFVKKDVRKLKKSLRLDGLVIGFVGRIVKDKGLDILLDSLGSIKGDWKLLMVGKGPFKDEMMEQAKKLGIEKRIVFSGFISPEKVPDYLNCMDILVLSSIRSKKEKEQFGRVLIEAMACEVAVIGSDVGGISNTISDAGLVFKEGSVKELRDKITLLMKNRKILQKYAKAGRKRVIENYTNKILAEKIYNIYKKLVG